MSRQKKVVLYFTEESSLTDKQADEMSRIPGARHRNAALVNPEDKLEKADGVAGPAIPDNYANAYETVKALTPAKSKAATVDTVEEEETTVDSIDYDNHTVTQLKELLTNAGVDYPNNAKKADLVALALEHLTPEEEEEDE